MVKYTEHKFTILKKCTVQWHEVHSPFCANITTIHQQVLFFKQDNIQIQWSTNNIDIFQEYLRLKIGANPSKFSIKRYNQKCLTKKSTLIPCEKADAWGQATTLYQQPEILSTSSVTLAD